MKAKLLLLVMMVGFSALAQDYPFSLPENFAATLNVTTQEQEEFNNLLLGTNIHDLAHSDGQELVRDFNPITIRFPHGLFANWYDWEKDKARVYGTDQFTYTRDDGTSRIVEIHYLSAIKTMDRANLIVGIDGLNALNNEKKAATGEGYDMMWTFNMSADGKDFNNGSPVSVARYQDLVSRGFQVKAIEMGNENFYAGQRSSIIPNPSDYIARAKSMYTALKALDPNLKISVPLERKSNPPNTGWNTQLTKDGTDYFDAVTVHTYVGSDPDDPANGDEAYSTALTAREYLRRSVDNYSKVVAPDKPIWLTEWGVKSGGPNAVSALGMADCYMFLSENQDTYERANWFSVNGKLNSHLVWHTVNGKETKKKPLEKTSYGSTYEIVRSVYENSTLLGSEMTVPTLDYGVNAVNARAVKKDGKTMIFALNLSNKEVPFAINLDGQRFFGEFQHKTFAFSAMDDEISLPYHQDPLELVKEGRGNIFLPKYSMNVIVLNNDEVLPLDFVGLNNNDEIEKGSTISIEAVIADEFSEVSLFVNNELLSSKSEAPYSWSGYPQLTDMMEASYQLKLVGKLQSEELVEREITITTPEQWAYTDGFKPHKIPGIIEAEAYDYGGDGIAFYDKSVQNTNSYSYRGDDKVDLSKDSTWLKYIQGNEWLEYSVEVERSGTYTLAVKHQTRRTPEFAAMTLSFEGGGTLFNDVVLTHSDGQDFTIDTISSAYLEKGRHILRILINGYGWDMDYFELILTSNAVDYKNIGTLNPKTNPESYDKGTVLEHLALPEDSLGFDFAGWFTNAEYTDSVPVPAIADTDDVAKTFYAKWQAQPLLGDVFIYGDIIDGNTLFADTSQIVNNSGELQYQWQESDGEEFINIAGATAASYLLAAENIGKQLRVVITSTLQTGEIISAKTNIVLAEGATTFTITYNANGGEDGMRTSEIVGEGGFPTFVAQPTREGYTLSTWTNLQGDTLNALSVISSDTTLYAQWEAQTHYKVAFILANEVIEIITDGYPATVPHLPEVPVQTDSVFNRWITEYGEPFDTAYLVFEDMEVYPEWQLKRFPINVVSPNGGILYEPNQSTFEIHSEVKLTAVPGSRYEFVGWTGDVESADSCITVVVDTVVNLIANYKARPYYGLDVIPLKGGSVSKFPNSSRYLSGTEVEITATPNGGYEFDAWMGDYTGDENPLTIILKEDMELFASFKEINTSVSVLEEGIINVFPNPNNGKFYVKLPNNGMATYTLFNINGSVVKKGLVASGEQIQLENEGPGIYILDLVVNERHELIKVVSY